MHTDSSAMPTCLRFRSTVECTATVRMPMVWQARRMRSAISPRLAITIFLNEAMSGPDHEQWLIELDRLAGLDQDCGHRAAVLRFDLVEHLHRLDQAERFALGHALTFGDEWVGIRIGSVVEGPDHGRAHDLAVGEFLPGRFRDGLGGCSRRSRRGRCRRGRYRCAVTGPAQSHRFLSFVNLEFGKVRFLEQLDQFFYFSKVHFLLRSNRAEETAKPRKSQNV